MVPGAVGVFNKTGVELMLESGAGQRAGFPDAEYAEKGVRLASRAEVIAAADRTIPGPGHGGIKQLADVLLR